PASVRPSTRHRLTSVLKTASGYTSLAYTIAATGRTFPDESLCARAECVADIGVHLNWTRTYQVETTGNRREYRVQADVDRRRTPRQIDDQAMPARAGKLARENGGRHMLQADAAHQLTEPFELPRDHHSRSLRRQIARRRPGAAGGQHEVAAF